MIPIQINTDELQFEFKILNKDVSDLKERILYVVSKEAERIWRNVVSNSSLRSTRQVYLDGIKVFKESQYKGGVMLVGTLPNMIENGCSAFDMKEGMLKSKKAKIGKNGQRYITVPFRIANPNALGESKVFSAIMPKSVYQLAKNLKGNDQLKQKNLPKEVRENKGVREYVKNETQEFQEYKHKFSIFAGIQKGQGKHHGEYGTFRRISDHPSHGSDPLSWIHSGIKAAKLANIVENEMESGENNIMDIAGKEIDKFLDNLGL